jgi:hypothetical protein
MIRLFNSASPTHEFPRGYQEIQDIKLGSAVSINVAPTGLFGHMCAAFANASASPVSRGPANLNRRFRPGQTIDKSWLSMVGHWLSMVRGTVPGVAIIPLIDGPYLRIIAASLAVQRRMAGRRVG